MRIGIVTLNSRPGSYGGLNLYTRRLVEALAEYGEGHEFVILVSSSAADGWCYRQWPEHIHFHPLLDHDPAQTLLARGWKYLRRRVGLSTPTHQGADYIAQQIDALQLDLVHYPETLIYPLSVQTPCVLTVFDLQQEYYPDFFTENELAWRAKTYRPSVEKATHLIVPTRYTRKTLIEKYQTPPDKMTSVPVGIAPSFRRVEPADIARIRTKYSLHHHFIYYPANPWQHKNHARLIAALRLYRARHGDAPWLVLSGRLRTESRDALSLAIAAGVEDRVLDLAFVATEDLPALYSTATLMVFPSLFEGFGIPLIEAMACGCPIVAADATTIPEVTNGAALLFDPFDPEAIADALHITLHDPELRGDLVEQGYRQLERFDWQAITAQLGAVYARTAQESRGNSG